MFSWCQQPTLSNSTQMDSPTYPRNTIQRNQKVPRLSNTRKYIELCGREKHPTREFGMQTISNDQTHDKEVQTMADVLPQSIKTRDTRSKTSLMQFFNPLEISHCSPLPQANLHSSKRQSIIKSKKRLQWSTVDPFSITRLSESICNKAPFTNNFQEVRSYHYKINEKAITTPQRRHPLLDKDTVVSKENSYEEVQYRVEQSVIIQRQIKSQFLLLKNLINRNINRNHMHIAVEKQLTLLVTLKQIPLLNLQQLYRECLIYEEMRVSGVRIEGVLALYQTYIDAKSCILIKQPCLSTLQQHILQLPWAERISAVQKCIAQVYSTIYGMEAVGFALVKQLHIHDIVVGLDAYLIENVTAFERDAKHSYDILLCMEGLKREMIGVSNK